MDKVPIKITVMGELVRAAGAACVVVWSGFLCKVLLLLPLLSVICGRFVISLRRVKYC